MTLTDLRLDENTEANPGYSGAPRAEQSVTKAQP
jgi:hypothetical protein